ncbi:MAG: phosphate transport system substrate-binding protein [Chloroflexota bacterium]|jgi:phosphate transport system substrate-binding protein|nr:phosphate transport system substrate-binding protein [Chloroflexota bacterium]
MKKRSLSLLALGAISLVSACGSSSGGTGTGGVTGTVKLNGSSALDPLVKAATDAFQEKNPGATVQSTPTDSGTGLSQVASGNVDIGMSDFPASAVADLQDAGRLVDHQVAVSAVLVITNSGVGVDGLSADQVKGVFSGAIKNWREVGGQDLKIVLAGRKPSSGTRKGFDKVYMGGTPEDSDITQNPSGGDVVTSVSSTPGAAGYVGLGDIKGDKPLKQMKIDGVEPTIDNVENGTYKGWFHEHLYTRGEPSAVARAFLDYLTSDEFQDGDAMKKAKFAPLSKVKGTSPADS